MRADLLGRIGDANRRLANLLKFAARIPHLALRSAA